MVSKDHYQKSSKSDDVNDAEFDDEEREQIRSMICKKSMVIIFNIVFMLSGFALCAFGIYTIKTKHDYIALLTSILYEMSTYILIICGGLVVLIAVFGIIGAWMGSRKILIVFIILLVGVLILEIVAGVLAFAYRAKLKENLKSDLDVIVNKQYRQAGFAKKSQSLDDLQIKFKCCGSLNFHDWDKSIYVQQQKNESIELHRNKVAESCCKTPSKYCAQSDHPSNIYYKGCVDSLTDYLKDYILAIGIVGFSIVGLQIFGILFAILLIAQLKKYGPYKNIKSNE